MLAKGAPVHLWRGGRGGRCLKQAKMCHAQCKLVACMGSRQGSAQAYGVRWSSRLAGTIPWQAFMAGWSQQP